MAMKYNECFGKWAREHPTEVSAVGINALLDEIDRLTAELEKHRWIAVGDNFQGDEVYIVEFQHGETGTCFVAPAYQSYFGCKHWMILRGNRFVNLPETYFASRFIRIPIPEPPKEKGER